MQKVFKFLKQAGTYYLATTEGDQPRVRPFGTILEYDGKLYIQTGRPKEVTKQLEANPKAELSAFDGEKWIRVACTLVMDNRIEVQEEMLNAYPDLRKMYTPGDDHTTTYYMKDVTAAIYAFGGEPEVIKW